MIDNQYEVIEIIDKVMALAGIILLIIGLILIFYISFTKNKRKIIIVEVPESDKKNFKDYIEEDTKTTIIGKRKVELIEAKKENGSNVFKFQEIPEQDMSPSFGKDRGMLLLIKI